MKGCRNVLTSVGVASLLIAQSTSAWAQIDELTARAYEKSRQQEAVGDYASAAAALQSASPGGQATYTYAVRMGWLMHKTGNQDASIGFYRRALSLAPASIEARMGLMLPLMAAKHWADAQAVARDILQVDRRNLVVRTRLAKIQYDSGQFSDAAATFHDIIVDYPADVDVAVGYAWSLLRLGRNSEALAIFRNVLTVTPTNAIAQEGYKAAGGAGN
jgi:tetratricopeptide (TPR) repeat protein